MKPWHIILGIVVAIVLVLGGSYISAYNTGNRSEQRIAAVYEDNENVLAQYGQQIAEAAQVPALQRDDMIAIFTETLAARYGEDGSKAAFQWLQEQNPQLDQETYTRIQRMIEAGRNRFETAQTRLVDAKRSYRTNLGSFWQGTWMSMAGYPKIKIGYPIGEDDDYPIITTDRASDAFDSGKESGPINLRSN